MTSIDDMITDVLRRELPPEVPWGEARARLLASDRGGWTRGGVTAGSWGRYRALGRPATPDELNAITEAEARAFYAGLYVAPFEWVWSPLRELLVDFGVTSSHEAVWRATQHALKSLGLYAGVVDGVPGPLTRGGITSPAADRRAVYIEVLDRRRLYYQSLAFDAEAREFLARHPHTQLHNARGWANRCAEFVALTPDRGRGPGADVRGNAMEGGE